MTGQTTNYAALDWKQVQSSNVAALAHHSEQGEPTLVVKFLNGSMYEYPGVTSDIFEQGVTAESVGKWLNAEIKPNYQFRQVYENLNADNSAIPSGEPKTDE